MNNPREHDMPSTSIDDFQRQVELLKGLDREVFRRVLRSETNLVISRQLDVPLATIKDVRERVIQSTGAKDAIERMDLARKAKIDARADA